MGTRFYIHEVGGLGIRCLCDINVSILCKWLWELSIKDDKLWKYLIFINMEGIEEAAWPKSYLKPYGYTF